MLQITEVTEVLYHPISENSNYCILKTRVLPSQGLNNKAYEVWALDEFRI